MTSSQKKVFHPHKDQSTGNIALGTVPSEDGMEHGNLTYISVEVRGKCTEQDCKAL